MYQTWLQIVWRWGGEDGKRDHTSNLSMNASMAGLSPVRYCAMLLDCYPSSVLEQSAGRACDGVERMSQFCSIATALTPLFDATSASKVDLQ